jgi:hypothetical protein
VDGHGNSEEVDLEKNNEALNYKLIPDFKSFTLFLFEIVEGNFTKAFFWINKTDSFDSLSARNFCSLSSYLNTLEGSRSHMKHMKNIGAHYKLNFI